MKNKILYSSLALFVLIVVLLKIDLLSIAISPIHHYKLNETETKLFGDALLKLRERVETGQFDDIKNDIAEGRISKNEIIAGIKKSRRKFGKPIFSEFFRSSTPEPASKYYENLSGTYYDISYFTNTDDGDFFSEDFQWIVKENNEVQLLNYSGTHMLEWQIQTRNREWERKKFQHEIKIPFGERFIEIRY